MLRLIEIIIRASSTLELWFEKTDLKNEVLLTRFVILNIYEERRNLSSLPFIIYVFIYQFYLDVEHASRELPVS